jgi:PD-(D/E)XK nuclease superfamily protein
LQYLQQQRVHNQQFPEISAGVNLAFPPCMRIDPSEFNDVTGRILGAAIEVKSTAGLLPIHQSQLLTYVGLTDCPAGLFINFNVPRLMDGVKRMINPRAGVKPSMSHMNET